MKFLLSSTSVVVCLSLLLLAACGPAPTTTSVAVLPTATPTAAASATPTLTPTPTPTATATPTATPLPTFTLSGVIFFDYNGNGLQNEGEPPIEGAEISLRGRRRNPDGEKIELSVVTDGTGEYLFTDLPADDYLIDITSPNEDDPAQAFRYLNVSRGWSEIPSYEMNGVTVPAQHLPNTDNRSIDEPLHVNVDHDPTLDVGLMQGYLTTIFEPSSQGMVTIWTGFDLDPRIGVRRNWQGSAIVTDNHEGIDYKGPVGIPVLAAAPGIVTMAGLNPYGQDNCPGVIAVDLWHYVDGDLLFETHYGHLQAVVVNVGEEVLRGQIIGTLGSSGECCSDLLPHVHFGFYVFLPAEGGGLQGKAADPYRDITDLSSLSYWTKDNDPQCLP